MGKTLQRAAGRPPADVVALSPPRWESESIVKQVQDVLDALEVPRIDAKARRTLQRLLYRRDKYFGGGGRGEIILLLRCILESNGNGSDALVEPIVGAVADCLEPEWISRGLQLIEAFDQVPLLGILQTIRGLEIFSEESIGRYCAIAIRNKVAAILGPAASKPTPKAVSVKVERKPPRSVTRIPEIEKKIALGVKLLELRSTTKWNNESGRLRGKLFEVDQKTCAEASRIAKLYRDRPEIYRRLSWQALVELSSPSVPAAKRLDLETRIVAGHRIAVPEIRRARQAHANRHPADQLAARMAA